MKLNEEQIDVLFKFTRKKWVHWYDLQVELVDHLASRIEEEMTADIKLSFQQALDRVYAGFGIFGFSKFVQSAEKLVRKKNSLIWRKALIEQFTWPNLVRSICILLLITIAGTFVNINFITFAIMATNLIVSFVRQYKFRNKQKQCNKLLLTQYISTCNFGYIGCHIYLLPNFTKMQVAPIFAASSLFLLLISFSVIILSIASRIVINTILTEAETSYPEIFTVSKS